MEGDDGLPEDHEWLLDPEDLVLGVKIGGGNFGSVFKGEYCGTPVAVKQVLISEDDPEFARKYIEREVAVLRSVRHPSILNLIGICRLKNRDHTGVAEEETEARFKEQVLIVTEWVTGGNLKQFIRKNKGELTWTRRVQMAIDIASAMAFLNKKSLIHRDLKPENLLVTDNGHIKICDFGFARRKPKKEVRLMTLAGTEDYMAPEVTLGEDYDESCDVYSFGLVLYVLIGLREPPKRSPATCFDFRPGDITAFVPPDCPVALSQLAAQCAKYKPRDRPSFGEALKQLKEILPTLAATSNGATMRPVTASASPTASPSRAVSSDHLHLPAGGDGNVLEREKARLRKTMGRLQFE